MTEEEERQQQLDATAKALKDARRHMTRALVLCSGYVEQRALEGDERAVDLARLVVSAHDGLTITNITAVTTVAELAGSAD